MLYLVYMIETVVDILIIKNSQLAFLPRLVPLEIKLHHHQLEVKHLRTRMRSFLRDSEVNLHREEQEVLLGWENNSELWMIIIADL